MKFKFKYVIALIAIASLGLIVYGFTLEPAEAARSHKFIGIGTVGLFLVAMPLFLITESRGKKIKDYMLTDENIRKMREGKGKNAENQ